MAISGEVIPIAVAPSEYRSNTASPILAASDLSRVWIMASVPESALARVQIGQPVTVTVAAYPGEPFEGRVARMAGALDPQTRTLSVVVELDNRRRLLKPEMFAQVRYSGSARPVVTVPSGAIVQDEHRTTVFVERTKGEFERREVSLGPRRNDSIVITSGLGRGERVVVDGTMLLMAP